MENERLAYLWVQSTQWPIGVYLNFIKCLSLMVNYTLNNDGNMTMSHHRDVTGSKEYATF